jgi:DNA invertase Pin-like site-specific DNA recombinase
MTTKAFAYLRTSSATNAGADKDSDKRQRAPILGFAKANKFEVVGEYYDEATKGADPIHTRAAFAAMLEALLANGTRTILVESASRFARDLLTQEVGFRHLRELGIALIAVDDPDAFTQDTPTANLIRQILGAVSEFQKAELVAKLAGARARKRAQTGRCEGRAPAPEAAQKLARRLHRQGKSLPQVSQQLAEAGFTAPSGKLYGPESIKRMLG